MAQSYGIPGRECSVAEFDAIAKAGRVGEAWKGFCDCMFREALEVTEMMAGSDVYFICKSGRCIDPTSKADFNGIDEVAASKLVYGAAVARGVEYKLRISYLEVKTPDWQKCMGVLCTLPWGCPHPDFPDVHVPFNVAPHVLFAPWTDLGAAARGIPKRNAGIFYTIGQVVTIDLSQYEPINLWKNKMTNPALYALNAWKLNLIPSVGTALANILNGPDYLSIPALAAAALGQCAVQQKDPVQYIFKPALVGGIANVGFALKIIGPALGQQYFAVAGVALAKYSQDQIDSGEINKILDPITNGAIRFFAESGEDIGAKLQKALGSGFSLKSASGIFALFEAGFGAIASSPQLDAETRRVFEIMSNAMRVIKAAATGFEESAAANLGAADTAFAVADKIVFEVFGFSLSELKRTVTQGGNQVAALLDTAKRKGKTGSLEGLSQALEAIVAAISKIADIISDISQKLDGALDKFASQFLDMKSAIVTARNDTATAFSAASGGMVALPAGTSSFSVSSGAASKIAAVGQDALVVRGSPTTATQIPLVVSGSIVRPVPAPAPNPAVSPGQPNVSTPPLSTGGPPVAVPYQPPPGSNVTSASGSSTGPALAGAALGFLLGGPAGAFIGAGVALAATGKPAKQMSGFGAYGLTLNTSIKKIVPASAQDTLPVATQSERTALTLSANARANVIAAVTEAARPASSFMTTTPRAPVAGPGVPETTPGPSIVTTSRAVVTDRPPVMLPTPAPVESVAPPRALPPAPSVPLVVTPPAPPAPVSTPVVPTTTTSSGGGGSTVTWLAAKPDPETAQPDVIATSQFQPPAPTSSSEPEADSGNGGLVFGVLLLGAAGYYFSRK